MKIYGKETTEISITKKCTVSELLSENNIYMPAQCGGRGVCGKCRIKVTSGSLPITDADRKCLSEKELSEGIRLACMAEVSQDRDALEIELQWNDEEDISAVGGEKKSSTLSEKADPTHKYGIAIDIGTTTLAATLVDITDKSEIDTLTSINHQRSFGADHPK